MLWHVIFNCDIVQVWPEVTEETWPAPLCLSLMPPRSSILDVQWLALTVKLPVYYRYKPELFFISLRSQSMNAAPLSLTLYIESPSKYHSFIRSQRGCCGCWFTPSSPLLWHALQQESTWLRCQTLHSRHLKFTLKFTWNHAFYLGPIPAGVRWTWTLSSGAAAGEEDMTVDPVQGICCCLTCCDEAGLCCVLTHFVLFCFFTFTLFIRPVFSLILYLVLYA